MEDNTKDTEVASAIAGTPEKTIEEPFKFDEKPKRKKISLVSKLLIFLGIIALIIIGAVLFLYAYYLNEIDKEITVPDNDEIKLTIDEGLGIDQIAEILVDEGLLARPEILKAYMYLNPDKVIQAGYYDLVLDDLDLIQLVEIFQEGSFEKKLTFIEGWRVGEYKDYLSEEISDEYAEEFISSEFIKEGYMFPDTYIIEKNYEPANLASWMRNTFDKRVTQEMIDQAQFRGLTLEEVVILASLVEREMNIKSERPVVAGILIKRLQNGWPLQVDAAVQYAKGGEGNWWPIVTGSDTKTINSPYNTYLNKGMPPGPISNPSLSSIEAVINYRSSPYWFYITGNDGVTRYAETLDEHNQNVEKYLR